MRSGQSRAAGFSSSRKQWELLRFRRTVLLLSISTAIVSALLLVLFRDSTDPVWQAIIEVTADAVFSGAVAALIFSTLASREAEQQVDLVLDQALRTVFLPLRSMVDENAIA